MCYIFGKQRVQGPKRQCSRVSDMKIDIHKYKYNLYKYKYNNTMQYNTKPKLRIKILFPAQTTMDPTYATLFEQEVYHHTNTRVSYKSIIIFSSSYHPSSSYYRLPITVPSSPYQHPAIIIHHHTNIINLLSTYFQHLFTLSTYSQHLYTLSSSIILSPTHLHLNFV